MSFIVARNALVWIVLINSFFGKPEEVANLWTGSLDEPGSAGFPRKDYKSWSIDQFGQIMIISKKEGTIMIKDAFNGCANNVRGSCPGVVHPT